MLPNALGFDLQQRPAYTILHGFDVIKTEIRQNLKHIPNMFILYARPIKFQLPYGYEYMNFTVLMSKDHKFVQVVDDVIETSHQIPKYFQNQYQTK